MKRKAVVFVVDQAQTMLVEETMRRVAGDALRRLTLAPVDGKPRWRITAVLESAHAAPVMRAVMKRLDESG